MIVFSRERKPSAGPWVVGKIENCTDGLPDSLAVWPEARLASKKRGSPICLLSAVEKVTLEDEDNAYLIAAAPELLEALTALMGTCAHRAEWKRKWPNVVAKCYAALAKVEGREVGS